MKKITFIALLVLVSAAVGVTNSCGRKGPEAPPDTLPPTIVSTSPYYNETNVPLNAVITVTFNESMDRGSINNKTVSLVLRAAAVEGTASVSGSKALFRPSAVMDPNSIYRVSITTGVKDISGNTMTAPFVYSFVTGTTTAAGTFTVTASAGAHGTISPATARSVISQATTSFTISADAGYHVVTPVGGTCGGSLSGGVYTTDPITADCSVVAAFAVDGGIEHTVTASAGAKGTISPSGAVTVSHGATRSFTITPNANYSPVTPVGGTCGGSLWGSTYTTNAVNADCTVSVSFQANAPSTHIVTASAGANGTISPSGAVIVNHGATRSFTITPNANYHVVTPVGGTCGGSLSGSTYTTKAVNADCTVSASFAAEEPVYHTITASADSNGEIIPSGAIRVVHGENKSFEIKADDVFVISSVEVDGKDIDIPRLATTFTYTFFNVDRNHKITAKFKRFWQIDASAQGSGRIIPSGIVTVEEGASQLFNMVPDSDSVAVVDVFVDGSRVGPVPQYLFPSIASNHTIWASFETVTPPHYTVTPSVGPHGSIEPDTPQQAAYNTSLVFTVTPEPSYRIESVLGCGGSLAGSSYTTGNISADCTVVATFAERTLIVTPAAAANGELSPADAQQVGYNGTTSFTLNPAAGYVVGSVSGCDGTLAGNVYTTAPVTADCTVTATFVQSIAI